MCDNDMIPNSYIPPSPESFSLRKVGGLFFMDLPISPYRPHSTSADTVSDMGVQAAATMEVVYPLAEALQGVVACVDWGCLGAHVLFGC